MIDMLHWVVQADLAGLERAVPVFIAVVFAAIAQLGVLLICASLRCKR